MSNKSNATVATMGIDIGKNSFHVVGLVWCGAGTAIGRRELRAGTGKKGRALLPVIVQLMDDDVRQAGHEAFICAFERP